VIKKTQDTMALYRQIKEEYFSDEETKIKNKNKIN